MSLPRFFLEDQVLAQETEPVFPLRLAPEDVKHARALRLACGEHIAVVDAAQDYFECSVEGFADGRMDVAIARHGGAPERRCRITLLQGLAKGEKMDAVIRQGTELGVSAFVPLACARSVVQLDEKRAAKKVDRWRAVAKSAAMQSGQPRIPQVHNPQTVQEACAHLADATAVLIFWEEAPASAKLHEALKDTLASAGTTPEEARIALVIGPEGGLAEEEVDALSACNPRARLVTLGDSILRTETAGVVAPALVLYELERAADA